VDEFQIYLLLLRPNESTLTYLIPLKLLLNLDTIRLVIHSNYPQYFWSRNIKYRFFSPFRTMLM